MKDFLKYVLATVTGIILLTVIMGILATISMVGIAASSASSTKVEENSVFTLMLSGQLDERAEENPLGMLSGQISENVGLDDIISSIRKAKENEDIKGIYIEAGIFSSDSPASSHAYIRKSSILYLLNEFFQFFYGNLLFLDKRGYDLLVRVVEIVLDDTSYGRTAILRLGDERVILEGIAITLVVQEAMLLKNTYQGG